MRRWMALFALLAGMTLPACIGDVPTPGSGTGGGTGGGNGDGSGGGMASQQQFTSTVSPLLTRQRPGGSCTGCHQNGIGPQFLGSGANDMYSAVVASSFLGSSGANSRFANIGTHSGPGFCRGAGNPSADCTEDEASRVRAWVDAELSR